MNIFDKLKLPFAKKVKQVPVSWVEEGPEHYYVIHHLLFGYSDSTSVPNGYADIFSDAEVHDVLEKARKAVSDMNLSVSSAKALDRITELKAARFFYEKLLARHNANLLSAYKIHSDVLHQKREMESFLQLRQLQLREVEEEIDKLTNH